MAVFPWVMFFERKSFTGLGLGLGWLVSDSEPQIPPFSTSPALDYKHTILLLVFFFYMDSGDQGPVLTLVEFLY